MKTYDYAEIFEDCIDDPESVLLKIPPEICDIVGLDPSDTVSVELTETGLEIKKCQKKT